MPSGGPRITPPCDNDRGEGARAALIDCTYAACCPKKPGCAAPFAFILSILSIL
jgi:hypothetical protein